MTFIELGLSRELLEGISRLGFETPTPVQAAVIPAILHGGRDLVALAQTGTGKTAAFGLPLLQLLKPELQTPQALILCPTRELCMQIARDLGSFAACARDVRILAVYGGADIQPQLRAMARGVDVVVATPGRMNDLLRRECADFSRIERVVLDEADEMLNMGFEEDLEAILSEVPAGAQTLLFSATMPRQVAAIARKYMTDPEEITVGERNVGAENVSHEYAVVHEKDRYRALKRFADFYPDMYGIVFCRTRIETQEIADHLGRDGYNAEPLHGDLTQAQRDRVMRKFRRRELKMLVATDVAARGLDVNDLTHIINYNLPDDLGGYTHRSGRTGRAGKTGVSIAIVNMRERHLVKEIERHLGRRFAQRAVPTGADICEVRLRGLLERLGQTAPLPGPLAEILPSLCAGLEGVSREELLGRFASLELRAVLDYYGKEPDLNAEAFPDSVGRAARDRKRTAPGGMVELVMNVGGIHGLSPKDLMNLVNTADRERSVEIGRIGIGRTQTVFELPRADALGVIESFLRSRIDFRGRKVRVAMAGAGGPAPARSPAGSGKAPSRKPGARSRK